MVNRLTSKLRGCDSGASAIEYALLIGLLALALIGAVTAVGGSTSDSFQAAADSYPES